MGGMCKTLLIVVPLFSSVLAFLFRNYESLLKAATFLVSTLTLFAVVWYTWETHRLRLQHFRPYVLLRRGGTNKYRYVNAGNGAALNVRVKSSTIDASKYSWDTVGYLRPAEESYDMVISSSLTDSDPFEVQIIVGDSPQHEVNLEFEDVEGHSYETAMRVALRSGSLACFVKDCRQL